MKAAHPSKRISATEARVHFGQVVDDIQAGNQPIYVERDGRPVLVIISPSEYERLAEQDLAVWDRISRIRANVAESTQGRGVSDVDDLIDADRD